MKARCSFCGRERGEVFTLFRPATDTRESDAASVYICDHCIESCHEQLATKKDYPIEQVEKQRFRQSLYESATETLIRAIVDLKYRDALLAAFAERAELAKVDPATPPESAALKALPVEFLRANRVLPWRIEGGRLVVAFHNPLHWLDIYDELVRRAGMPIRPALLPREVLVRAIEQYVGGA